MSSSIEELRDAMKENLEQSGTLKRVKAELRADVMRSLRGEDITSKPELSPEALVINELIREYLIWSGYRESLSIFIPESGQPEVRPFDRSFLSNHLNMSEGQNARALPLLFSLVAARRPSTQD